MLPTFDCRPVLAIKVLGDSPMLYLAQSFDAPPREFKRERYPVHANMTILCIDDEALGLQIRKIVLERAGYRVLTALDGDSGLSVFQQELIDAVVLDYAMPGMNGSEVATVMRRNKPKVPILLHSAYVSLPDDVLKLVDVYVTKGDGPETLLNKLQDLLRNCPAEEGGRG